MKIEISIVYGNSKLILKVIDSTNDRDFFSQRSFNGKSDKQTIFQSLHLITDDIIFFCILQTVQIELRIRFTLKDSRQKSPEKLSDAEFMDEKLFQLIRGCLNNLNL